MFGHSHHHHHAHRHCRSPDGQGRGFGRHRGWERGHGGRRLVILQLIAEKPSHGYEIIKAIEERIGGDYSPSPGVIYPTLTLLEEMGYATVQPAEGGRKLYAVTDEGRAFLEQNRAAADAIFERMAETRS